MSNAGVLLFKKTKNSRSNLPPFRLNPIAAGILSLALITTGNAYAADDQKVSALEQEVARLKAELEKSQRELAAQKGPQSSAQPENTTPSAEPQVATGNAAASEESANLDSVVVKGRKKTVLEKVKDVPASVSIVSGEELESLQATNITEVLRRVGNVNFNYGNSRTGSLTLRGITTGSSDQIDPSIGTVLDGVSIAYTPLVNGYIYTDIDTVDVTRGPQGTTGGKASNIGRITFKTRAPTFIPEAQVSQTFGDWNTLKTSGAVGGPVVDGLLAWRGSFVREQADGPFKNKFPDLEGRTSYQNVDRTFGRVQFLLTPTDTFNAKLSLELQPRGDEFVNGNTVRHPEPTRFSDGVLRPAAAVDVAYKKYANRDWFNRSPTTWNPATDYYRYMTNTDNNGAIRTGSKGATINLDWTVAGHLLESITGYRGHWFSAANDEGTPFDITKSGGYITDYSQLSQEFRISSEKGGFVDYTAGVYLLKTDNDSNNRTRYGNDAGAFQASDPQYNLLVNNIGLPAPVPGQPPDDGVGSGQAMIRDSLNLAYKNTRTYVENTSTALYGQADWHLSEPLTLTTGYRISREDRQTAQGVYLADEGVGADYTKAFGTSGATTPTPGGPVPATTATPLANAESLAAADRLAKRYFGSAATYAGLGQNDQLRLLTAARIRNATLSPATFYLTKNADKAWQGNINSANISLANKFNENLTVYGTLQYGEKAGISQIDTLGKSSLVDKEKTVGYEVGFRSWLLNNTLVLNADVFLNDIKDFQTTVAVEDPVATASFRATNPTLSAADSLRYQSIVGNLPGVRVKGIELDAGYTGFRNLSLRIAASYNDARYSDDAFLAKPSEINSTAPFQQYYNAKGDTLNNAPKISYNLSADYRLPVFGNKVFHAGGNYNYRSSYQVSPSSYDEIDAYGLLDLAVGLGRKDGLFDANFIVKNAFNQSYHVDGFASYTPSLPRWVGVVFSTRL